VACTCPLGARAHWTQDTLDTMLRTLSAQCSGHSRHNARHSTQCSALDAPHQKNRRVGRWTLVRARLYKSNGNVKLKWSCVCFAFPLPPRPHSSLSLLTSRSHHAHITAQPQPAAGLSASSCSSCACAARSACCPLSCVMLRPLLAQRLLVQGRTYSWVLPARPGSWVVGRK
jgi:hypothetical protein